MSASSPDVAANWVFSDEFIANCAEYMDKHPPESEGFNKVSKVCTFEETVGTLYKHGLLNEELLFDWLAASFMWERVKGFALEQRERFGLSGLYENFEAMAKAQEAQ
jgi:hypothetical protein